MQSPRFFDAVQVLTGNAAISGRTDGPIEKIRFRDDFTDIPSNDDVNIKFAELQAAYDSKQYQRDRAATYPSWQDQLDNIYHNGIDAWKADIQAIKDQFPKP